MELFFIFAMIILSFATSLGVGSSTIAVANFFTAIADGAIDESERNLMGVTYWVLRVAMVLILLMYATQLMFGYAGIETPYYASTHAYAVGVLVAVLYSNAILMTYRLMPSTFGPAIQAGSWYTLGVMTALIPLGITHFSLLTFGLAYVTTILLAISLVNFLMLHLKHRKKG